MTTSDIANGILHHFEEFTRLPATIARMPIDILILTQERMRTRLLLIEGAISAARQLNQLTWVLHLEEAQAVTVQAINQLETIIAAVEGAT